MTLKEIAAIALDEVSETGALSSVPTDLQKHDAHFHPKGFKEGDSCKFRDRQALGDDKIPDASVEIADITKQDVDAIVNAANRWMLGGGGVDGAIHRAAGPELLEECKAYPPDENGFRVQTGEAKITGAGRLAAKKVVHTAGPDVREFAPAPSPKEGDVRGLWFSAPDISSISDKDWDELDRLLGNSYRNSLELAAKNGAKSIAFPSISTGIFGFPLERAAKIAAKEISEFRAKNPDVSVKMCVFDPNPAEANRIKRAYDDAFSDAMEQAEDADDATGQPTQPPADPSQMTDLQKHDAKYHPKGYKEGDSCKYREKLAKGDDADQLDPENVDGEAEGGSPDEASAANAIKRLQDLASFVDGDVGDIASGNGKSAIWTIQADLDAYEKGYADAAGITPASKALSALGKKIKGGGLTSQLLNARLAAQNASAAAANLPPGTRTPQEMRNAVALAIAKALGANLSAQQPAAQETPAPAPAATQAPVQRKQPAAQQPAQAPQQSQQIQFGPRPSLTNDETAFPDDSDFDFGNYGKTSAGYHSSGSGSTNPHWIDINGQRYYVKQAGNNPTYNNAAAQNEVNANKFLRLAGLLAPESKLYTHNGVKYCVTKAVPHTGKLATSNLNDPNVVNQLREAYPVMDLMYNTDILQNDNAYIDKNGDIAYIDNGSSFGTSAQGTRNSKKKFGFDYDHRSDPYSGTPNEDYGALAAHASQSAWKQIASGTDINEQAAKWNLGALAKEAINQGLVPKQAQTAFQQFADALDATSASRFPSLRPSNSQSASPAAATPAPSTASSSPAPAPASAPAAQPSATAQAGQGGGASAGQTTAQQGNGSPIFNSGAALYAAMSGTVNSSWNPNVAGSRQSRNAQGFLNAVASLPTGAFSGPLSSMQFRANQAIAKMLNHGTFTANKSGVGGTVTGANIPRRGVQAVGKYLNQLLNPKGYKIQIHNNGNISISASNRGIANAAMQSAGVSQPKSSAPAQPASNQPTAQTQASASQPASPAPAQPAPPPAQPTPSPQTPTPPPAQPTTKSNGWQNTLSNLQQNPKSKALGNTYNTIANWLNGNTQAGNQSASSN